MKIQIRQAIPNDLKLLQSISIQTFSDTFAQSNTPEDMAQYLEETFNETQLTQELNDPNTEFYLASSGTETIGYLKLGLNSRQPEFKTEKPLEIERIYVSQSCLGQSVGQQLLDKAISTAKEKNCAFIWLGVWKHNPRAIRFYEKNGFTVFGSHPFKLGNDLQTDLLMKRAL